MEYMDGGSLDLVKAFRPLRFSQTHMAGDQEGRKDRGEVPEKNHLCSAEGVELSERKASDNPQVFCFFLIKFLSLVSQCLGYVHYIVHPEHVLFVS